MSTQPITFRTLFTAIALAGLLTWSSCTTTPTHTVPAPIAVELEQ